MNLETLWKYGIQFQYAENLRFYMDKLNKPESQRLNNKHCKNMEARRQLAKQSKNV